MMNQDLLGKSLHISALKSNPLWIARQIDLLNLEMAYLSSSRKDESKRAKIASYQSKVWELAGEFGVADANFCDLDFDTSLLTWEQSPEFKAHRTSEDYFSWLDSILGLAGNPVVASEPLQNTQEYQDWLDHCAESEQLAIDAGDFAHAEFWNDIVSAEVA